MIDPVQRILTALREHGHEPRKAGAGWCCRCPAHDDRNPSLSIHAGDDGRALVNCHAGCTVDAVCAAIGLRPADLFADDPTHPSRRNGPAPRSRPSVTVTKTPRTPARNAGNGDGDAKTFPTARAAVAEWERSLGPRSATWTYTNAAGEPVGLVLRWNTPTGKLIRPVSRNANGGGWVRRKIPDPHPLYRLPDLLTTPAAARVWVCEGEPAADAARAIGLRTTTSAGGAKRAEGSDWSPMAGRDVAVAVDNDDAGEEYGADVVRLCMAAGAKSVRIVRLVELWAGMPEGGDMADLVNHRGGDVDPIRAEVEAHADRTEPATADAAPDAPAVVAFKPFPVDLLPEPIRSFVADGAKAMGCDPSFIALPLLAALAAAIGNTYRIELKRGWSEPAILWTAMVGESGTTKTPAFKAALKAIRKAQAQAFKEYDKARAVWEAEHLRYDAELTAWKRKAVSSKGNAGDPPENPVPPIARRYVVSDTTVEALAPILLDNPRGVLLARDELTGWLGSFDRYAKSGRGGADSAHWLSMHNGEAMTVDRKTGAPRTIHVPAASVGITGGIQPGILARAMGQEHHESGMLARMLFAMPPRKAKRWTEADVAPMIEAAVVTVFGGLFGLTMEVDPDSPLMEPDYRPRLVKMTPAAKAAWVRFYNEHNTEQADLSGDLAAAWSKLEGYAARLALVVHLIRWAAGKCDAPPGPVDEASIAAGVALSRWFGDEARRVYAMLGESDDERETRRLVEWIDRRGGTATASELAHGVRTYRCNPDGARAALAELVAGGYGRWESVQGPKGGRPTDRFRRPHAVTVTETAPIPENGDGIGDSDAGDTPPNAGDGWGEL